jgi:hypothetical protein
VAGGSRQGSPRFWVQEVGMADQVTQERPRLDVALVIRLVSIVGLAMDRHCPIGSHRDAVHQLFEVWSVVLVVTEGDPRRSVRLRGPGLVTVGARGRHSHRVVVHLPQFDTELTHGVDYQSRELA